MKKTLVYVLAIVWASVLFGQEKDIGYKKVPAMRCNEKIEIDGSLSEISWEQATPAQNFVVYESTPGLPSSQNSEIKLVYDDKAIYIGAYLYDTDASEIMTELTPRDNDDHNADVFVFEVNPYQDGQNAFFFKVTAANVQIDYKNDSGTVDYA